MSNRIDLDDPDYSQERVVVQDKKAKLLWVILGVIAVIVIIAGFAMSGGNVDSSGPDPNRTTEPCSFLGTAKVFGSAHISTTHCVSDGDGYYNPAFGHHHHK